MQSKTWDTTDSVEDIEPASVQGIESETAQNTEPSSGEVETDSADSEAGTEPAPFPPIAGPDTVLRDLSESERGTNFVQNDTDRTPLDQTMRVSDFLLSSVILLIYSRPYEAYADGNGGGGLCKSRGCSPFSDG